MKALVVTLVLVLSTSKHLRFNGFGDAVKEVGRKFCENVFEQGGYTKEMLAAGGLGGFLNKANVILDMASTVIDMFRTSITDSIKEFKEGKGFDFLKIKTEADVNFGFRKMGYDVFLDETIKALNVPEQYREQFIATLEESNYLEKNKWGDFNILFHKDSPAAKNELNFINVMVYNYREGEKDKFDSIIIHGTGNFHLKANEYIWTKSKFIAGGIEQSQTDYKTSENRDIKAADIKALVFYFQTVTLLDLYKAFGIDLTPAIIKK